MNETNTNAAEATENAAENTAQQETEQPEQKAPAEKTFTQKELDEIVKQRLDRAKKDMPSKEELKAYHEWKNSQKTAEQKAADDLAAATSAKEAVEREKQALEIKVACLSKGVLPEAAEDVMAKVEAAGYDVDGFAARIGIKNTLRKLRDANGAPTFVPGTDQNELYNQPIEFVRNGAWKDDQADLIAGKWKYSLVGIRDDIEYEILKEATLQNTLDEDGKPLSLAEQDMLLSRRQCVSAISA